MNARLDRGLTRLYRLAGAALFLALCGHAAYRAGVRGREAAILCSDAAGARAMEPRRASLVTLRNPAPER